MQLYNDIRQIIESYNSPLYFLGHKRPDKDTKYPAIQYSLSSQREYVLPNDNEYCEFNFGLNWFEQYGQSAIQN